MRGPATTQSLRFSKAVHRAPCGTDREKKSPRLHCAPLEELSTFVLFCSRWWRPGQLAVSVASLPSGSSAPEVSLAGGSGESRSACPNRGGGHQRLPLTVSFPPLPRDPGKRGLLSRDPISCAFGKELSLPLALLRRCQALPNFPDSFHLVWDFAQVSLLQPCAHAPLVSFNDYGLGSDPVRSGELRPILSHL